VDRVSIVVGCCAGIDRRGESSGCGACVGVVMALLLRARQRPCVAKRLLPARESPCRARSEDSTELRRSSTRRSGIAGGCGGRAKHAAEPSSPCAIVPTSTARTALAGWGWLGSVINRARVARPVEGGSSSREPSPRCGTTCGLAIGWYACRVALCAMPRSFRSRSGGSTPPGLRCTELPATSSTPTTRSRTAAKTRGGEVKRGARVDGRGAVSVLSRAIASTLETPRTARSDWRAGGDGEVGMPELSLHHEQGALAAANHSEPRLGSRPPMRGGGVLICPISMTLCAPSTGTARMVDRPATEPSPVRSLRRAATASGLLRAHS
jgi:hypothetical protein